ncbi:hypothetical protein UY3_14781 [Chelonia mydas]|uniref:Uncharacterized protein n=1 Tax=Chelonia mydas TaxID=8469 RepID=M7AS09_CHEMY|nr:hypothetical protein UY3_14781 [Chelonia mydas]
MGHLLEDSLLLEVFKPRFEDFNSTDIALSLGAVDHVDSDELPEAEEPVPSVTLGLLQHFNGTVLQSLRVFGGTSFSRSGSLAALKDLLSKCRRRPGVPLGE